jgi:anti-sigma factor RsiW
MTCSPSDLKNYFFGELNGEERERTELHVQSCFACRDELNALSATQAAVLCLREEEPPRRIAFVSDKVFEPRWWQRLLASGPKLAFRSAAMLSAAIVFHSVHTAPVVQLPAVAPVAQIDQKAIEAEIEKRVQVAVEKAVSDSEALHAEKLLQIVNARFAKRDRQYETGLKTVVEYIDRVDKRGGGIRRAAFDGAGQ